MDDAIGAHIRSKVKWIEDGERSTSYFLAVEKHRQGRNVIKSLKKENKTYVKDHEILDVAKDFYAKL